MKAAGQEAPAIEPSLSIGPIGAGRDAYVNIGATESQPRRFAGLRQAFLDHYLAAPFVGRDTDLQVLDDWIADSHGAGPHLGLLTAPAGRGKSAVLTRWVERIRASGRYQVVFVPISARFNTNRPEVSLPALAAELSDTLGRRLEAPAGGVVEGYQDIILDLLGEFTDPNHCCLLVIDGADETMVAGWELGQALLPAKPNQGLRILVSARPLAGDEGPRSWITRLGWFGPHVKVAQFELGLLSNNAVRDLIGSLSADDANPIPAHVFSELVEQVFRLSEKGDPLLVRLYSDEVREAMITGKEELEAIVSRLGQRSPGLRDYFANWMRERSLSVKSSDDGDTVTSATAEAALVVLASGLGPLLHEELIALLRAVLPKQNIPAKSDLLTALARFVVGDGAATGYTLGHPRFNSFLLEEQYAATPLLERAKGAFLEWGCATVKELEAKGYSPGRTPRYVLNWYPWHVLNLGKDGCPHLAQFLTIPWIQACRETMGDGAFAVVGQAVLGALLKSLEGPGELDAARLSEALRASLLLSSLGESSARCSPELLVAAFECDLLDERGVLAPHRLLNPGRAVGLLMSMMRSPRLNGDRIVPLWLQAVDFALLAEPRERPHLLDGVLWCLGYMMRRKDFDKELFPCNDLMRLLGQRFAEWPGHHVNIESFPFSGFAGEVQMCDFPFEKLRDLLEFILNFRLHLAVRPCLLKAVLAARVSDEAAAARAESPGTKQLRSLAEGGDRAARALTLMLDRSSEPAGDPVLTLDEALTFVADERERIELTATMLGVADQLPIPGPLKEEILRRLQGRCSPADFVLVTVLACSKEYDASLAGAWAARGWEAASDVTEASLRIQLRKLLIRHVPDTVDINVTLAEEIEAVSPSEYARLGELRRLLFDAGERLQPDQRRSLAGRLDRFSDEDRQRLTEALEWAHKSKDRQADPEREVEDEFETLLAELRDRPDPLLFSKALDLANRVQLRIRRPGMLAKLVGVVPQSQKKELKDVVAKALAESGVIDDRDVAIQAMVILASRLPAESATGEFNRALELLRGFRPIGREVDVICNAGWRLPEAMAAVWATRAREAAVRMSSDPSEMCEKMTRVANMFPRQVSCGYVAQCLKLAIEHREEAWMYQRLINMRGWRSWLAAGMIWHRRGRMTKDVRASVDCFVIGRHPRLFRWLAASAQRRVSTVAKLEQALEGLRVLAVASKGKRRQEIVAAAVDRFVAHLDGLEGSSDPWVSEHHDIRYLYELANTPTRQRILAAISSRQTEAARLIWSINLFPGRPSEERADIQEQLFSKTQRKVPRDVHIEQTFGQLVILLNHWVGNNRRPALISTLRLGAEVPRRTWLGELPDSMQSWRQPYLDACAAPLLQSIKDALFLWP